MTQSLIRPVGLTDGLLPNDPRLERYWVRPGGITAVQLTPGDELTVIDRDGGRTSELTVLSRGGSEDFPALGLVPDGTAPMFRGLLDRRDDAALDVLGQLHARGADPATVRAVQLFGESSAAGAFEVFSALRACIVVVGAPDVRMRVYEQDPPSDLVIELRRAENPAKQVPCLPQPLASPILDLRVDAATACSYEVKAGQYIQIIDVQGRQCSDFLAFDSRKLDAGIDRSLDSTATRYHQGRAYPRPGLHGKFLDQDMRPLVEVVQDTVGRHDTFGLACNSKFYEDFGYFGHTNCTDNFNRQLQKYQVAARRSWPALNLFYNTFFDQDFVLMFDEPWSRPGDYVLFRAATDLVCASSACPDDIDPANAWNPTDIHVRVYSPERPFRVAISRRTTPESERTMTKTTGFDSRTRQLTRQFSEYRGYWVPDSFDNIGTIGEYWGCRQGVAVMDLSPLRKVEVTGPDAEDLIQYVVTRNVRKLAVGQVAYTAVCHETGGMVDDATVFRMSQDGFRFVGGDPLDTHWLRDQAAKLGLSKILIKESSDQLHNLALQGPLSRDLLSKILWTPETQPRFEQLGCFRFTIGRLHDSDGVPVLVSRTGYTGELGYEVWCHPNDAPSVWDSVWAAGEEFGIVPLGMAALDILRIEAALPSAGHEFDDTTDPFEAGIGFTVPLKTKEDDFIGREALVKRKANPRHVLVGLEIEGNEVTHHGDEVYVDRYRVGVVTSGTRSPILRKNIALCRVDVEHSSPGTALKVGKLDGQLKRLSATVVPIPFYDPERTRLRS